MIAYANKFAELRPLFVKVYQNKRRSNMASLLERLKYIIEDIFGKKTYAELLFCKLNDAPVVTLNDAITV